MPQELGKDDVQLQKLFQAAHRDRSLKLKLLAEPKEVAAAWGVELGDREAQRLGALGAFVQLADEAKFGRLYPICDPRICYPSTVWLFEEVKTLVGSLISDGLAIIDWEHIYYPPPALRARLDQRLRHNLGMRREMRVPRA